MESSLPSTQILDFGESAEGEKEAKSYKEMISTFPRVKRWSYYEGFWYSTMFLEGIMSAQDHFIPQSTDIFITSCPKTGTTWLKSLTFAICTRSRLSGSSASALLTRMPHDCVPLLEHDLAQNPIKRDCAVPLVSTHLPYSCLPRSIISSGCKMIYICRDAKDAFVSFWYFIAELERSRNVEPLSLEEAFELFCNGISSYGPYWDHVLGYWRASLEFPEKILFLTYEEMKKDTAAHVKKLAEFMGCSFTLEEEEGGEVQKIISMCSFQKLSNLEVNKNGTHQADTPFAIKNSVFFRKGEIGDWVNHLTPEMGARLDGIMEQKLKGSGLKLPRDAKDAFVSLWYFIADLQRSKNVEPVCLEEAFELFCNGISSYGPYWDHVLGYWRASLEYPEKILFLTYEEMKKDTAAHVKKLAEFMGCSFTLEEEEEGEVQKIISMCSFEKLSNLEVNKNGKHRANTSIAIKNSVFFRKGEIGDWANNLTPEMGARLDEIMEQKLKGSGLKLPR